MNLLTILILSLKLSLAYPRSIRHGQQGSNKRLIDQKSFGGLSSTEMEQLRKLFGEEVSGDITNTAARAVDKASLNSEFVLSEELAGLLERGDNDAFTQTRDHSNEVDSQGTEYGVDNNIDSDGENENSYFLTEDNEVDKYVVRYLKNFSFDMITLFLNEIKEFAQREKIRQKPQRKHRRPSLRPKRSIRGLLKDAHIKDILMKYFRQKQKEENGKPLLRYG